MTLPLVIATLRNANKNDFQQHSTVILILINQLLFFDSTHFQAVKNIPRGLAYITASVQSTKTQTWSLYTTLLGQLIHKALLQVCQNGWLVNLVAV